MYAELSAAAQTAFASVASAALSAESARSIAAAPGGFATKAVHGQRYWYHQIRQPDGRLLQTYLGKATPELDALVAQHKDPTAAAAREHLRRLAQAALALGCDEVIPRHAMVIQRLHDHGFFRVGGVLLGTHCFLAYQNMFGVRWTLGTTTVDLDFAHSGRNLSLALPDRVDTHAAIESLRMGFVPNADRSTYKKADEPDFDLDFLTALRRTGDAPVHVEALNVTLQPLRFLEFSMEAAAPAVLLSRRGPIVVNMPPAERYAVHKLLVCGERPAAQRTKALKDVAQAATLVDYLGTHDPEALAAAWADLQSRGPGWRKRAAQGVAMLRRQYPALEAAVLLA
ncbi:GSU2403 family nucleotidyltransferase fold protein [Ideonella sp.]|uniref:GSU2403 family nucleotidyltransferase fold protein n=1 Tax=Ideonella sp. TaxID=1929293 RepID=UPI0035B46499